MEKNEQLTEVINNHEAHMDRREFELAGAHADVKKLKELHETLVYDNTVLRSSHIFTENKLLDVRGCADERYDLLLEDLR
eukprot:8989412-Heterocapsa_arctica.AAC.1